MSADVSPDVRNQRIKEFLQVLPLTTAIAGLPDCHPDKIFTADQLDLRCTNLRIAYKLARSLLKDVADGT